MGAEVLRLLLVVFGVAVGFQVGSNVQQDNPDKLLGVFDATSVGLIVGAGLGFSKLLGLLLATWLIWLAASLGIAPYGKGLIIGVLVLLAVTGLLVGLRLRSLDPETSRSKRLRRLALPRLLAETAEQGVQR